MGLILLIGFCMAWALPGPIPDPSGKEPKSGDIGLYRAEAERIHAGEGYYAVAAEELVARGYPTRSVFNWRTPLPVWLIGKMPAMVLGKVFLCALALAVLMLAFELTSREQPNIYRRAMPLVVLLLGPLLSCLFGDVFLMPILWAGTFLTLSVCAYGADRPKWGVAAGLAAVFFRELALPYCLLCAALACWQRRRAEVLAWMAGLAAWAVFFGLHWWQVSQYITPDAPAHGGSWIQFGGTKFVLATAQMNWCLLLMPSWITAIYFVAAMFGLAGWHTPMGLRAGLTVCLFIVAFSIVGYEFNRYWGLLIAPLMCFGVVRAPVSLVELWQACRAPALRLEGLEIGD